MVAKHLGGRYHEGQRTNDWIKIKAVQSQEFVIGGYTAGQGSRKSRFGALLVGVPAGKGRLIYAGRVGTGFDERLLAELQQRFTALRRTRSPFTGSVPEQGVVTWLKPELVAELKFAEWTPDRRLRAPVFLRLREDLTPQSLSANAGRAGVGDAAPSGANEVVEQLQAARDSAELQVEGHRVRVAHLDKVLWPAAAGPAQTKRDLLRYLATVASVMLPHLRDRPLTMIRMPDGILGERFLQKHWAQRLPEYVDTITVFSESRSENQRYLVCNNLAALLWLGQVGTLEFHIWHSRANTAPEAAGASTRYTDSVANLEGSILNYPDYVVFDIDPYLYSGKEAKGAEPEFNRKAFAKGKEVAWWLKEVLDDMKLEAYVKTSGKTGLHIFVPVVRTLDFDAVREVSEMIGRHLLRQHPRDITMEWAVNKRTGKIFMDYNMNVRGKTLSAAYSPRGVAGAPVSMPLRWDELDRAQPGDYTFSNIAERLRTAGDPWRDLLAHKRDLNAVVAGTK